MRPRGAGRWIFSLPRTAGIHLHGAERHAGDRCGGISGGERGSGPVGTLPTPWASSAPGTVGSPRAVGNPGRRAVRAVRSPLCESLPDQGDCAILVSQQGSDPGPPEGVAPPNVRLFEVRSPGRSGRQSPVALPGGDSTEVTQVVHVLGKLGRQLLHQSPRFIQPPIEIMGLCKVEAPRLTLGIFRRSALVPLVSAAEHLPANFGVAVDHQFRGRRSNHISGDQPASGRRVRDSSIRSRSSSISPSPARAGPRRRRREKTRPSL